MGLALHRTVVIIDKALDIEPLVVLAEVPEVLLRQVHQLILGDDLEPRQLVRIRDANTTLRRCARLPRHRWGVEEVVDGAGGETQIFNLRRRHVSPFG